MAPEQAIDNGLIVEGAFSAKVDCGRNLFLGDAVFFEIGVRPGNSSGAYQVLPPRQELTAAPDALKPAAGDPGGVEELEVDPSLETCTAELSSGVRRRARAAGRAVTKLS